MKFLHATIVTIALTATSVSAQSPTYSGYGTNGYGTYQSNQLVKTPSSEPLMPRVAVDKHDIPTLGDPQPRIYGKEPTLGDSRSYRKTSPATCTGLLCD